MTARHFLLLLLTTLSIQLSSQITEFGLASFYADKFNGRVTASGEIFDQDKLTAAHRTLPFGTTVKITNTANNKTVTVTINDRGPFVNDRVIDLSKKAAQILDFVNQGVAQVKIEVTDIPKSTTSQALPPTGGKNQPVPQSNNTTTISSATNNGEYYKIESTSFIPQGFAIQIASYHEAANLLKLCNDISEKNRQQVFIQVAESNGNKLYRVLAGPFNNRADAEKALNKLEREFNSAFIIQL